MILGNALAGFFALLSSMETQFDYLDYELVGEVIAPNKGSPAALTDH